MEAIVSSPSLFPFFNNKTSSPKTLFSSCFQPKSNLPFLSKPITSITKNHSSQSSKPSFALPTRNWFSYVQQGLAALALSLALNFSSVSLCGNGLASEFDVLNERPPKESYVVDDTGILSRVTKLDLKSLLSY